MGKRLVLESLVLVGMVGLVIGFYALSCFAQEGETITITTYYPSPYGVYNELRANKMVIGESDSGAIPSPDTEGVMIFKGISEPTGSNDQQDGALYYDDSEHKFKYYDGSAGTWKEMGGIGTSCVTIEARCGSSSGPLPASHCPQGYVVTGIAGGWCQQDEGILIIELICCQLQ